MDSELKYLIFSVGLLAILFGGWVYPWDKESREDQNITSRTCFTDSGEEVTGYKVSDYLITGSDLDYGDWENPYSIECGIDLTAEQSHEHTIAHFTKLKEERDQKQKRLKSYCDYMKGKSMTREQYEECYPLKDK